MSDVHPIPAKRLLRINQVLALVPVGRSSWWEGCRTGRYPKPVKLGPGSTDYLIDLWLATAMNHPSGLLQGMDETDIALESSWDGEPGMFVAALLECGFLEKTESGAFALHDWQDHQGYVVHADARKEKARKAAAARWEGTYAPSMPGACSGQCSNQNEQCPLPSPSPDPAPIPVPSPAPKGHLRKTPAALAEDSEAYRLAVLMRDTLKINLPTLKEPNLQQWARSFDVALRNDERMAEAHFVAEVIKWACSDIFWRTNIQSPEKLRKQFDKLTAKMESEAEKARTASKAEKWASPAERRVENNQGAGRGAKRLLFGDTADVVTEVTHDAS